MMTKIITKLSLVGDFCVLPWRMLTCSQCCELGERSRFPGQATGGKGTVSFGLGRVLPVKVALGTASLPLTLEHTALRVGARALSGPQLLGGPGESRGPLRTAALLSLSPGARSHAPSQPSISGRALGRHENHNLILNNRKKLKGIFTRIISFTLSEHADTHGKEDGLYGNLI